MIEEFKKWMINVQDEALAKKRIDAKKKGDESKWKSEIWKSPEKNKAIKSRFQIEGEKREYKPRSSSNVKAREWLYDFVWRKFDEDGNLISVDLTMEIEVSSMNVKGIKYDFNKLLQADSKYKILVFQLKTEREVTSALDVFFKTANSYHNKSTSAFLLCGWSTALNQFIFKDFVI